MHKIYMTEKTGVVFLWIKCCENCAPGFWPNYRAHSAQKIMTTLEILIKKILHFDDLTHTGTQIWE